MSVKSMSNLFVFPFCFLMRLACLDSLDVPNGAFLVKWHHSEVFHEKADKNEVLKLTNLARAEAEVSGCL